MGMERMFQAAVLFKKDSGGLAQLLKDNKGNAPKFSPCHDIEGKIVTRFVAFRLKIHAGHLSRVVAAIREAPAATGSLTAAAKAYVSNPRSGKRKKANELPDAPPKKRGRPRKIT